ncbi:MAG: 3-methyl-2-oxobutanoate hydroxymethyltransferase [Beijerinckiaceae bacterium]
MSIPERFFQMKRQGRPIAVLTAYDAPSARVQAEAGIDLILVGDSVGTNVLGYRDEREVTLADILHHVRAVRRGAPEAAIAADLPYGTYETGAAAVANAREIVAAGANIVKFEGARPEIVAALKSAGIAVSGHLGLEPQHHAEKRLKGKTAGAAQQILDSAVALDKAGLSLLILELIPEELAAAITKAVAAPTIGIGAGRGTDGQVLVITDMLGTTGANFRHNRRYAEIGQATRDAVAAYAADVRNRRFPGPENIFLMPKDELGAF